MLARINLTHDTEGFSCDLVVATANMDRGLYRSGLVEEGLRSEEPNPMKKSFLWLQWPVLKAGTVKGHLSWIPDPDELDEDEEEAQGEAAEGESTEQVWVSSSIQDLKPEQFLANVPEAFGGDWIQAILELNPRWVMRTLADRESDAKDPAKKKLN